MPASTVNVKIEGRILEIIPGTPLHEILVIHDIHGEEGDPYVLGAINGMRCSLAEPLWGDETVGLMPLSHPKTHSTSVRSLCAVLATACDELLPERELVVDFSLGEGMVCRFVDGPVAQDDLDRIEAGMRDIVARDLEFVPRVMGPRTLVRQLRDCRLEFTRRAARYVFRGGEPLTQLGDGGLIFHGLQLPSSGHVRAFALHLQDPGFVLLPSRIGEPDLVAEDVRRPQLLRTMSESACWTSEHGLGDLGGINRWIESGRAKEIIRLCEARHTRFMVETAARVEALPRDGRLVLAAGPSSSGKTSTAKRLAVQLQVLGLQPFALSLDDYFVDREATPRDESGRLDYESIDALKVDDLNRDLAALLAGESVRLPRYDFHTGTGALADGPTELPPGTPLIIEGLHALNPRLAATIPAAQTLRVYVSALCHPNIDNVTYLPTTMGRLVRRIVRDAQFRGYTASETLARWPQVREGEDRWIFPHQENADVMFNSGLAYELGVLKLWAEPRLAAVRPEDPSYGRARGLLGLLRLHLPIDARLVPPTSLLREFVGESGFSY